MLGRQASSKAASRRYLGSLRAAEPGHRQRTRGAWQGASRAACDHRCAGFCSGRRRGQRCAGAANSDWPPPCASPSRTASRGAWCSGALAAGGRRGGPRQLHIAMPAAPSARRASADAAGCAAAADPPGCARSRRAALPARRAIVLGGAARCAHLSCVRCGHAHGLPQPRCWAITAGTACAPRANRHCARVYPPRHVTPIDSAPAARLWRNSASSARMPRRSACASPLRSPCFQALRFPTGAPLPAAPPCMRQRRRPRTRGA